MRHAYYNENEPFAAEWLRNLITAGHISAGVVDDRSIVDVRSDDLKGFAQCHFFAGIGGWAYALQLAGWPVDRPVWTGSCPCQPFSNAGKGNEFADARHLWPAWFALIGERRPSIIFGEQVAVRKGLAWFDHVATDLEAAHYAVAAADLCAAGAGAPHIRQRLWFVAYASIAAGTRFGSDGGEVVRLEESGISGLRRAAGVLADTDEGRRHSRGRDEPSAPRSRSENRNHAERRGRLGDAERAGLQGGIFDDIPRAHRTEEGRQFEQPGREPWAEIDWLACRDGKNRPTKPELFPLAHGIPGRVGRLRAYGNAIVPQVAAEFIRAVMDCLP
jgi:DNA (cytosine-5)-methyltransferase 1